MAITYTAIYSDVHSLILVLTGQTGDSARRRAKPLWRDRRRVWKASALILACWMHQTPAQEQKPTGVGSDPHRASPPAYRELDDRERRTFELGRLVFKARWRAGALAGISQNAALGPHFNAPSCDACHNDGSRGRGPTGNGVLPVALVMQLGSSSRISDPVGLGDPAYGRVLNTQASPGIAPEARVEVRYSRIDGRYPDGQSWSLRRPRYVISSLAYGPLAESTVLRPRLAPSIFGVGLLEAARTLAVARPTDVQPLFRWGMQGDQKEIVSHLNGHFGWQGKAASLDEQTASAFAREMGVTTTYLPRDDCTLSEAGCPYQGRIGKPVVADPLWDALLSFERLLGVPRPPARFSADPGGKLIFEQSGCANCHAPTLRLKAAGTGRDGFPREIHPYSDLQLHDMGADLDDRDVGGRRVHGLWRTAPLWGIADASRFGPEATFLHDARARSVEEAILWHGGEARSARDRFCSLAASERHTLLRWIEAQ